jgi:preprotein translocase subunit YajC
MHSVLATIVLAQEGSGGGGGGAIIQLGILLLIPAAMYFLMIRPQRRRQREQRELQSSISVGDEVVTNSGIFGIVTGEDGPNRFWLEVDDDVQIRIARAAIQGKTEPDDDVVDDPTDDDSAVELANDAADGAADD